ncbi:MAG: DUF1549 domain-containing protein, partial [Saprospiraceae bacterium]|nr:DUF1549 domain-containing protein [Saprospiraceae bacterium]
MKINRIAFSFMANWFKIGGGIAVLTLLFLWFQGGGKKVDFNQDVKPLLNKECMSCHGGVKSSGGLSFLFVEEAMGTMESGKHAIVPGHPGRSELYQRLLSPDPELRMPLEKKPLSSEEIDVFRRWIEQGAKWEKHWSYKEVEAPQLPPMAAGITGNISTHNDMDLFVSNQLQKLGLSFTPQAPVADLARRMSLDITGLPPQLADVTALGTDPSSSQWEDYVHKLLDSPHYGEKWAAMWMDLARYADTKGYERDDARTIWRYRDWLIKAFNTDKPYNTFLIEQIAGDLLPDPTDDQLLATAFHRNTMTNDEGGTDNEEFRVAAVIDRVNTTWETILGTSFSCVQCHSHPYDPIKHEDFYRFMAFFNNSRDEDTFSDYPVLRTLDSVQQQKLKHLHSWLEENAEAGQI